MQIYTGILHGLGTGQLGLAKWSNLMTQVLEQSNDEAEAFFYGYVYIMAIASNYIYKAYRLLR